MSRITALTRPGGRASAGRRPKVAERDVRDRFWTKVQRGASDRCWHWLAYRASDGYGRFRLHGRQRPAHRIAYELTHGNVLPELFVLHACDNRSCCNPLHLYVGTQLDNMKDRSVRGRMANTAGINNARHKLSENQVRKIRSLLSRGFRTRSLATAFGVSLQAIRDIRLGRRWGSLA